MANCVECVFFDVGQASANLINLGDERAIIIDTGHKNSGWPLIRYIERYCPNIELLILTHNDRDHDGGVETLLERFVERIKKIYFLDDRDHKDIRTMALLNSERFRERVDKAGVIIERLERTDTPVRIFEDARLNIELKILFPDFQENLNANTHNAASGVIQLDIGTQRILFGGDAELDAWKAIHSHREKAGHNFPLQCNILTIPHHGGKIGPKHNKQNLDWLYNEAINSDTGVISAGSRKRHHPREDVITAIVQGGTKVICTQRFEQCDPGFYSKSLNPDWFSLSHKPGDKNGIHCMGSVVAHVYPDRTEILKLKQFMRYCREFPCPLCIST